MFSKGLRSLAYITAYHHCIFDYMTRDCIIELEIRSLYCSGKCDKDRVRDRKT